jgi:hypothetical protein
MRGVPVQEQEAVPERQHRRLGPLGRETGDERVDRLVLVRGERTDVDQGRHLRVGACLADNRAAVGVANQHHRSVLGVDDQACRRGVALQGQVGCCTTATW